MGNKRRTCVVSFRWIIEEGPASFEEHFFVMRVSRLGCLNKMGNFKGFLSTALVFLIFELCLVCCDMTDGNTEHLKRENSLMKPYQGKTAQLAR